MYVSTDKQTLDDLSIVENTYNSKSLFSIFNNTSSDGGKVLLNEWLLNPLNDLLAINERVEAIKCREIPRIRINREELDFIEYYLNASDKPTESSMINSFMMRIIRFFRNDPERYIVERGTELIVSLIEDLNLYVKDVTPSYPQFSRKMAQSIHSLFENTELKRVVHSSIKGLACYKIDYLDYLFRYKRAQSIREILKIVYQFDVIYAVSDVAAEKQFTFPVSSKEMKLSLKGFYHPHLKSPIVNDWEMKNTNICIFTGSNMAGKSTTLKTVAILVWLAHCGFPVPASYMEYPLFDGIFTSINLPDSLMDGRSHFYSEVMRVKEILIRIREGKNCFVLFDELFRGTNARDAYEASEAIVGRLKEVEKSMFLISTHIIELAKAHQSDDNCCFYYLHSEIKDGEFMCYYKLKEGISESRVGYWIVKKEILDEGI